MSPAVLPASRRTTRRRLTGTLAGAAASVLTAAGLLAAVGSGPAGEATAPALREAASDPVAECASAVVDSMSLEERVGQLFVSGVDATAPTAAQKSLITQDRLGGVILTGRSSAGVAATRRVTDGLRGLSGGTVSGGVRLWVATDQEGGYVQVLSGPGFSGIPTALSQGGLPPATLRRDAGTWARQLLAAGVDLNLAPVLDTVPASLGVGNKPIGYYDREYGYTPGQVAASGTAFAAGMRDEGIQATAKHFPGLGRVRDNTDTTTGVTDDVTTRYDAYLQPFAAAVNGGIPVVMVSSAIYSKIDPSTIATFSPTIVTGMLRGDLGFDGVIMSDSLGAAALANTPVSDRAVQFIEAGGDVALSSQSGIVTEMVDGVLSRARSDSAFADKVTAAARTVIAAKYEAGLVDCPPGTGPGAEPSSDTLLAGQRLTDGRDLVSGNGRYRLVMQTDGNLVVYDASAALWNTRTFTPGTGLVMQGDGNLVAYTPGGRPVWYSGTAGSGANRLVMQDDGNLVLYRQGGAVWATNTEVSRRSDTLQAGQRLTDGQELVSGNGRYRLAMQGDGNLVVDGPSGALWASHTFTPGTGLVMQGDGNLVAYAPGGRPVWYSGTAGSGANRLVMQDDGNLVLYQQGRAVWATNT